MTARSQTLRNTLFSSVGIYTEYFLGMLTSILIARKLGPDQFGLYSLMIWLVAVGTAVTNSGTASAAIKFVAEMRGGSNQQLIAPVIAYLRRMQRRFLLAVLALVALAMALAGERLAGGMDELELLVLLAIAIPLRAGYMFNIGVSKGFENFRATAMVALIVTPLNLAMVLGAWLMDAPLKGFLVIFIVSSAVFFWISKRQVAQMMPAVAPDVALPDELVRRLRRHMLISAGTVTITFVTASDVEVLFLNLLSTSAAAGHFKVAHLLATGASVLVPGVFGAVLLPLMASALAKGKEYAGQRFVASTNYLTLLAAPVIAFGMLFAGPVIVSLYGAAYAESAVAFAALLFAYAIAAISAAGSSLLISADRQHTVLKLVVVCGALKILLDIVLIRQFGFIGAVIASCSASLINAVAMMLLASRTVAAPLQWSRLLRIVGAAAITALVAMPMHWLWTPVHALFGGALVVALVYPLLTVILGCWNHGDLTHIAGLHRRLLRGKPKVLVALLAWASDRAPKEAV